LRLKRKLWTSIDSRGVPSGTRVHLAPGGFENAAEKKGLRGKDQETGRGGPLRDGLGMEKNLTHFRNRRNQADTQIGT